MAILHKIYLGWNMLVYVTFMLLAFIVLMIAWIMPWKVHLAITNYVHRCWGVGWCFLIGVRYKVVGREKTPANTPCVFVLNHNSFMDTPATYAGIRKFFKPLAKKELTKVPIMGQIIAASTITVDRKSAEARLRSMKDMKREIARGGSIMIFPEGTQNRTTALLQPFHNGAFKLAAEAGVPVVPIVITGSRRVMPQAQMGKLRPGVILMEYLDPIFPEKGKEKEDERIRELVIRRMTALLQQRVPGGQYPDDAKPKK